MSSLIHEVPQIVDALPYIDTAIDDDENKRSEAMREVDDYLEEFPPQDDYIKHLPDVPSMRSEIFKEYEREFSNKSDTDKIHTDLAKVIVEVPPPISADVGDEFVIWIRCINQMKIKLEYLRRQSQNLDDLNNSGRHVYEQHLKQYETLGKELNQELERLNTATQSVNWDRKKNQEYVASTMNLLEKEWRDLAEKNRVLSDTINTIRNSQFEYGLS